MSGSGVIADYGRYSRPDRRLFGGLVDNIIMRVVDIMLALPVYCWHWCWWRFSARRLVTPPGANLRCAAALCALNPRRRAVEVNRDYVTASRVAGAGAMRRCLLTSSRTALRR